MEKECQADFEFDRGEMSHSKRGNSAVRKRVKFHRWCLLLTSCRPMCNFAALFITFYCVVLWISNPGVDSNCHSNLIGRLLDHQSKSPKFDTGRIKGTFFMTKQMPCTSLQLVQVKKWSVICKGWVRTSMTPRNMFRINRILHL